MRITRRRDNAFVLAWVLIVILFLAGLGTALMDTSTWEGITVAKDVHALRAFNVAEAGAEWGIWKLSTDVDWSGGTMAFDSESCGVIVTELEEDDWYRVTATAVVNGQQRSVSIDVRVVEPAFGWPGALTDYAIYWGGGYNGGGDFTLKNLVLVNGPMFVNGDLEVERWAAVYNGTIETTGTVYGGGYYSATEAPEDAPQPIDLDTTSFDADIATANAESSGNWTRSGSSTYNLDGDTLYVKGNVEIKNNAIVRGPGRIVATGNITIKNNAKVLGSVDLISGGNITIQNDTIVEGEGNTIYGANSISVKNLAAINPYSPVELDSRGSSLVITPPNKEIEVKNLASVRGIVWGGRIDLLNLAAIQGVLYGHSFAGNNIKNLAYVHYDATVIDAFDELPAGVPQGDAGELTVTLGEWSQGAVED